MLILSYCSQLVQICGAFWRENHNSYFNLPLKFYEKLLKKYVAQCFGVKNSHDFLSIFRTIRPLTTYALRTEVPLNCWTKTSIRTMRRGCQISGLASRAKNLEAGLPLFSSSFPPLLASSSLRPSWIRRTSSAAYFLLIVCGKCNFCAKNIISTLNFGPFSLVKDFSASSVLPFLTRKTGDSGIKRQPWKIAEKNDLRYFYLRRSRQVIER